MYGIWSALACKDYCICTVFYTHHPASPHNVMLKYCKEFSHYFEKYFSLGKLGFFEKTAATMTAIQPLITSSQSRSCFTFVFVGICLKKFKFCKEDSLEKDQIL